MRPLRLEIEGLTAFKQRTELDFSHLDLFAITGETGAGKSSIIDAICYALYGRIPRVGADVKDCISHGLERMAVTMEFQAGGHAYRLFRETRRKGAGNVRLEKCVDGDWAAMADRARGVDDAIEALIGVDFDGFTRSVLLPQGQFQEFLAGSPEKRREVLKALLRLDVYERVRGRASVLAGERRARLAEKQNLLANVFGEATPENLARQEDELQVARAEALGLSKQVVAWKRAEVLARSVQAARAGREEKQVEHDSAARHLEAARELARGGEAAIEALRLRVKANEEALAANSFDPDLLAGLTVAANLALAFEGNRRRVNEAETVLKARKTALQTAEGAATDAAGRFSRARKDLDAAEHALARAQRANLAASLQAGLAPGDRCPVCGGAIEELPALEAPDFELAISRREGAATAFDAAQDASTKSAASHGAAEAALKAALEALDDCKDRANADLARLDEALPGVDDRSSRTLQTAIVAQRTAREERHQLSSRLEEAIATLVAREKEVATAVQDLAAQEKETARLSEVLDLAVAGESQAQQALRIASEDPGLESLRATLAEGRDAVDVTLKELERLALRDSDVQQDVGRLVNLIDRLKDDIEKAQDLRNQARGEQAEYDVAADLAQILGAKFHDFIQSESLRTLAENGSARLQRLSGERYRLCVAENLKDFEVVDQWNADDRRSVKTLSGGETFLASLALALALAESLPALTPDHQVTLDAIFLDEGFGALDPEALDRAAEALDSLRDGARMVCVVTHLQELAQRMPARILVSKSETGSSAAIA